MQYIILSLIILIDYNPNCNPVLLTCKYISQLIFHKFVQRDFASATKLNYIYIDNKSITRNIKWLMWGRNIWR